MKIIERSSTLIIPNIIQSAIIIVMHGIKVIYRLLSEIDNLKILRYKREISGLRLEQEIILTAIHQ